MSNKAIVAAAPAEVQNTEELQYHANEINRLTREAQQAAMYYSVMLGRELQKAKEKVPHGEWGTWLSSNTAHSQSTANNFMRIATEYGDQQISLFGAPTNSQTFENLSYTKLLVLLSVPKSERAEFAEEVDAENISVRKLEEAVREYKREKKAIEAQLAEVSQKKQEAEAEKQKAEDALIEAQAHVTKLEQDVALLEQTEPIIGNDELSKIRLEAEEKAKADAAAKLKKAKERENKLKAEAMKSSEQLEKAKAEIDEAKRVKDQEIAALQREMKKIQAESAISNDENAIRTRVLLESIRDSTQVLVDAIRTIKNETLQKNSKAAFQKLIDYIQKKHDSLEV